MPLFYQQYINETTRLAIWKIEESETFFAETIPLQREISHPHKRLQHLAGRYLLRYLFPDFPFNEIIIASTRKPFLADEKFHFSISHCGDFAAAIVSKTERVGIDIEIPTDKILKIAHKFVNEEEKIAMSEFTGIKYKVQSTDYEVLENELNNIESKINYRRETTDEKQQTRNKKQEILLTLIWSAKETMFKWYSIGNVDFKEMLFLHLISINENGKIKASIKTDESILPLTVQYNFFEHLVLTFTHTGL